LEDLKKERAEEKVRWWELYEMTFGKHDDPEEEAARKAAEDARPKKPKKGAVLPSF